MKSDKYNKKENEEIFQVGITFAAVTSIILLMINEFTLSAGISVAGLLAISAAFNLVSLGIYSLIRGKDPSDPEYGWKYLAFTQLMFGIIIILANIDRVLASWGIELSAIIALLLPLVFIFILGEIIFWTDNKKPELDQDIKAFTVERKKSAFTESSFWFSGLAQFAIISVATAKTISISWEKLVEHLREAWETILNFLGDLLFVLAGVGKFLLMIAIFIVAVAAIIGLVYLIYSNFIRLNSLKYRKEINQQKKAEERAKKKKTKKSKRTSKKATNKKASNKKTAKEVNRKKGR